MKRFANCTKCGVLFPKKLRNICDSCLEKEKKIIEKIVSFVKNCPEPAVSITVISENTGIELKEIQNLYNKGRLTDIADRITTRCKICGTETKESEKKGHFCPKCVQQMITEGNIRDPEIVKAQQTELKKFEKDIMHSKLAYGKERQKFGFKKSFD